MNVTLRTPTAEDAHAISRLCDQLGYPSTVPDVSRRLSQLQGPEHFVLTAVAESGDLVGWIHACIVRRLESDSFVEVGGMVVADGHRGKGVGATLLAEAERWAAAASIGTIRVRCNVVRERAHGFYLRAGYAQSKTSYVFQKPLK